MLSLTSDKPLTRPPLANPDGTTGIRLHISVDDLLPESQDIAFRTRLSGTHDDFLDLKLGSNNAALPGQLCGTDDQDGHFGTDADRSAAACKSILGARGLAFRYVVFGHSFVVDEQVRNSGGISGSGVALITQKSPVKEDVAGTFMHELGHTLGLCHGGPVAPGGHECAGGRETNYKPNYLSVMNYTFQLLDYVPSRPLDYSRWVLPELVESSLDEPAGIGAQNIAGLAARWPHTAYSFYDPSTDTCPLEMVPVNGVIDWNHNLAIDLAVPAGINDFTEKTNDKPGEPAFEDCQVHDAEHLLGHEDWHALRYNFLPGLAAAASFGEAIHPLVVEEPTTQLATAFARHTDDDSDGRSNLADNCRGTANPGQADTDADGIGDACSISNVSLRVRRLAGHAGTDAIVTLTRPAPRGGANLEIYTHSPGVRLTPDQEVVPEGRRRVTIHLDRKQDEHPKLVRVNVYYKGGNQLSEWVCEATSPRRTGRCGSTVVVQPGDTLWSLAARYLGAGDRYQEIVRRSIDYPQPDGRLLHDPELILPGWIIKLPDDRSRARHG